MKAEERKELQTNSLIRFVGRVRQSLKGGFKGGTSRRTKVVWGIVLLAAVVFIIWRIVASVSASRNSHRWVQLGLFTPPGEVEDFIAANSGTTQARAARLQQARADLRGGLADLYTY